MKDGKIWSVGLAIIIAWVLLGLILESWPQYQAGATETLRKSLYLLPFMAALLVSYFSDQLAPIKSLALVAPIVILGPLANFIMGEAGFGSDFPGLDGLKSTFWIFLITALITVVPGALVGTLMKRIFCVLTRSH